MRLLACTFEGSIPGWLSDLNSLLTRKLPMFLSRVNEKK